MITYAERIYWLALAWHIKIGPSRLALLRRHFPKLAKAWQAKLSDFIKAGLDNKTAAGLFEFTRQQNIQELIDCLAKYKIEYTTLLDDNYPKLLKEINDPPPVIFYKGDLQIVNKLTIAIVGSRLPSSYGLQITEHLAGDLSLAGCCIISGLAYGIDTQAHLATLEAGGQTLAVLAGGLNKIYPPANSDLANRIIKQGGCLLSEFPPNTPYLKQNFPYRNRLIAGLSKIIIVAEAREGSGALITAQLGLDYNREIWAVPGNINNPLASGPNELIKQGAGLITNPKDVIKALAIEPIKQRLAIELNSKQTILINSLEIEPKNISELAVILNWPIKEILAELTLLELAGYVMSPSPEYYARAP